MAWGFQSYEAPQLCGVFLFPPGIVSAVRGIISGQNSGDVRNSRVCLLEGTI